MGAKYGQILLFGGGIWKSGVLYLLMSESQQLMFLNVKHCGKKLLHLWVAPSISPGLDYRLMTFSPQAPHLWKVLGPGNGEGSAPAPAGALQLFAAA